VPTDSQTKKAVYLDCNATTPLEPSVAAVMQRFSVEEFGNAGSRTHDYGAVAKRAVQKARDQVGKVVEAKREEVVFTSGATESNNLAILGLAEAAEKAGKCHVITSQIEHKAVIEPFQELERRGFEVTYLPPSRAGYVEEEALKGALREDTFLVSLMHVNNETGVIQPLEEYCWALEDHAAYFHVDVAQSYGKGFSVLENQRLDLLSVSGHKIYGPKGVGALVARRRGFDRLPLRPLLFGGGQERGLRPGTIPVHLVVGLGEAAELGTRNHEVRTKKNRAFRGTLLEALQPLDPRFNGDPNKCVPHVLNISFRDLDSEAVMVALRDLVAISNGSACTSHSYEPSHVLEAMGCSEEVVQGALRFSWCHMTPQVDWEVVVSAIKRIQ